MGQKTRIIYAQADPEPGGIVWGLGENLPISRGDIQTVSFAKNNSYDVTVELIDNTTFGLEFDSTNPLWAKEGSGCPQTSGITANDIPKGSVGFPKRGNGTDDRSRLIFKNTNQKKGTIGYQLNFVDSDGNPAPTQLDPEFKNGGTGGGGIQASGFIVGAGGAIVGAVVAVLTMPGASPLTIAGVALGAGLLAVALFVGTQGLREGMA